MTYERIHEEPYDNSCDIYSLGLIIDQIITSEKENMIHRSIQCKSIKDAQSWMKNINNKMGFSGMFGEEDRPIYDLFLKMVSFKRTEEGKPNIYTALNVLLDWLKKPNN